jgi:hypothetical protein
MVKYHTTRFDNIPLTVNGVTYKGNFFAKYVWTNDKIGVTKFFDKPHWDCISIINPEAIAHNGEDIYDGLCSEHRQSLDEQCIYAAEEKQPLPPAKTKRSNRKRS